MTLLSFVCILSLLTQQVILNSSATETGTEIGHEKSERSLDLFSNFNPFFTYTSKVHKRFLMLEQKLEIHEKGIREIKEILSKVRENSKEIEMELTQVVENHKDFVEETRDNFCKVQRALAGANDKIQELELSTSELNKTQVPIGFVYVQMAGQQEPEIIWPSYTWEEISELYAGLFFRAEGGASAPFGDIQDSTCPRITQIMSEEGEGIVAKDIGLKMGQWSEFLQTGRGEKTSPSSVKTQFLTSNDEVTPKNQAIKIWRRIA